MTNTAANGPYTSHEDDIAAANELVRRMSRDLRQAAMTMTDDEARFLVDLYYQMQKNRMRANAQLREMRKNNEPHAVVLWFAAQTHTLEAQVKGAIAKYVEGHKMGKWCLNVHGIGPVITAGILARIDITTMPTAGHMWAYAGFDPTKKWEKGKKRPWNAALKRICYLAGDSFVKHKANDQCYYGQIYEARKAYENGKNESHEYEEQAAAGAKRVSKDTIAYTWYSVGKLPPGHIHMRCVRYAVKMFLSHLHQVWWERETGTRAPVPFAVAHLGHTHIIPPPHEA